MRDCPGENCNFKESNAHSKECKFEHFQSYSGYFNETEYVQFKIKTAYFHGFEAGNAEDKTTPLFSAMGLSEHNFPSIK